MRNSFVKGFLVAVLVLGLMGATYGIFSPGGALSGSWDEQSVALDSGFITGDLPDANLSANVPLLDAANAFTGDNTFSGTNTFNGISTDSWSVYESGPLTLAIQGSGTPGTYEIGTQKSRFTRIGNRVFIDVYIQLAGSVTGGGTVLLTIVNLPYERIAEAYPQGSVLLSGVDYTAGANLALSFQTSSGTDDTLIIQQTVDNVSSTPIPISGIGANDLIVGSITYETADPF